MLPRFAAAGKPTWLPLKYERVFAIVCQCDVIPLIRNNRVRENDNARVGKAAPDAVSSRPQNLQHHDKSTLSHCRAGNRR